MADDSMVDCPVEKTPEVQLGSYANAIRVKRTAFGEHVLDFLLYSEIEDHARVVSRIRISDGFVPQVVHRLQVVHQELALDRDSAVS